MRNVTNRQLLAAAIAVLMLVASSFLWRASDQYIQVLIFIGVAMTVGIVFAALDYRARNSTAGSAFWSEEVSNKVGSAVTNVVACAWLGVVALVVLVILIATNFAPRILTVVVLSVVFGVLLGRFLQNRFAVKSLLPFAISFLFVLLIVLVSFATIV